MGSPRLGALADRVDPERQAAAYARGGAARSRWWSSPTSSSAAYDLLSRAAASSGLPAIAKDFVVDERQLEWATEPAPTPCC